MGQTEPMQQHNLTQGSIPRLLALFSWPMVLTNFLQTLYGLADVLIVGRFIGTAAMSAVTVGGQTGLFLTTFSMGLSAGGQILIAQLKGARQTERQRQVTGTLFGLSLAAGILVSILGFFLARPILGLLQTPEEAMEGALSYMRLTALGLAFVFLYNAIAGVLRGLGDSRWPLLFAAVAAVFHIGLCLLFVGPLSMGVAGAALSTVIAQAVASLLGAATLFFRRRTFHFDFHPKGLRPHLSEVWPILKIGLPFGLQMGLLSLSNLFITRLINPYGVAASAALGAGNRVTSLLTVPMMAIGNGASTIIGQSMGAKRPHRVSGTLRWALVYTLAFTALTAAFTLLFPAPLLGLFTRDPKVLEIGVLYLQILAWAYMGHALHSSFNAVALGVGFTAYSLLAASAEALVGRIGLTFLLSHIWALPGMFTAQAIAPYLAAILSFSYWLSRRWKHRTLVE